MRIFTIAGIGIGLVLSATHVLAQNVSHAADGYKLCASCHGFRAEGSRLVNAPALAGLETWYLERQIRHFRDGIRGADAADTHGKVMANMTKGLDSEQEIADIVAYIGTLPAANPVRTIAGDADSGRKHYASCVACHGAAAEGNAAMNAPALVTTDDWYQLRQLQLFKDGLRGAASDDTYGQQMRPMAGTLADEKAMRDVVTYIQSLDEQ